MSVLPGERGVWELTIPGTHDSGARRGGPRPQTQTMDIGEQLRAGIRFLDIRLKDDAGVFRLHHGDVDQREELETGVLEPLAGFLAEHPGETAVMSVKQEDDGDDSRFAADFERLVAERHGSFHVSSAFPRLDEVRGKVVVFRRYGAGAIGIPAAPGDWRNDATFRIATPTGALVVEDDWDLGRSLPWQLAAKWSAVAGNLDAAAGAAGAANDWYITFTSATSDLSFPRLIAAGLPLVDGLNQRLLDRLAAASGPQRLGTVVMDFPNRPLIQALIDTNG